MSKPGMSIHSIESFNESEEINLLSSVLEAKHTIKTFFSANDRTPNHDGFFDPIYLMFAIWYRRHRFICRKEFFDSWAKLFFKGFLCIPIDKSSFGMNSFREITDSLKAGYLVSMFPEGQINSGDGIAAFKSGVVLMALQGKVPIIPVYIRGKKHFWNRVIFVIGEAIDIQALYGDRPTFSQIESIAQLLHEREEKLKEYIQKEES